MGTLLACCQGCLEHPWQPSPGSCGSLNSGRNLLLLCNSSLVPLPISTAHPSTISNAPSPLTSNKPFPEYSCRCWGIHEQKGWLRSREIACAEAINGRNDRFSIKIILEPQTPGVYHIHHSKLSMFNGLHRASIFGTNHIVACLVKVEVVVDKEASRVD